MSYPFIFQGSNVTLVIGTTPHTFTKNHIMYNKLIEAIKANNWDVVQDIVDPKKCVLEFGNGNIEIQGSRLFWKGLELHNSLTNRIVDMIQQGFSVEPLVKFMENLMQNPSKRAVNELYGFLEKNTLPITPDGCFLAYKKINESYHDCYSGTVLNKPAIYMTEEDKLQYSNGVTTQGVTVKVVNNSTVVSMDRNQVDDNQNNTCSVGLHFCSRDYLNHFGGDRIVILKINPRDVVSIPTDYNNAKGRCCSYEIVDEIDKEKADEAFLKAVQDKAAESASVQDSRVEQLFSMLSKLLDKANDNS